MTSKEDGFAMADTIVALMIVALFAVSLIGAARMIGEAGDKSQSRLYAAILAKSLLEDDSAPLIGARQSGKHVYDWKMMRNKRFLTERNTIYLEHSSVIIHWDKAKAKEQSITLELTRLKGTPYE